MPGKPGYIEDASSTDVPSDVHTFRTIDFAKNSKGQCYITKDVFESNPVLSKVGFGKQETIIDVETCKKFRALEASHVDKNTEAGLKQYLTIAAGVQGINVTTNPYSKLAKGISPEAKQAPYLALSFLCQSSAQFIETESAGRSESQNQVSH